MPLFCFKPKFSITSIGHRTKLKLLILFYKFYITWLLLISWPCFTCFPSSTMLNHSNSFYFSNRTEQSYSEYFFRLSSLRCSAFGHTMVDYLDIDISALNYLPLPAKSRVMSGLPLDLSYIFLNYLHSFHCRFPSCLSRIYLVLYFSNENLISLRTKILFIFSVTFSPVPKTCLAHSGASIRIFSMNWCEMKEL